MASVNNNKYYLLEKSGRNRAGCLIKEEIFVAFMTNKISFLRRRNEIKNSRYKAVNQGWEEWFVL